MHQVGGEVAFRYISTIAVFDCWRKSMLSSSSGLQWLTLLGIIGLSQVWRMPGSKILHQLNKLIPDHIWPPSWGNRLTVKAGFHEVEPGPKTKGQLTECEHKITNKCW